MFILVLTVDLVFIFVFTQFHSCIFRITDATVGDRGYEDWIIFNVSSTLMTTFVIDSSISFHVITFDYDSVLFIDLILYSIIFLEYITFLRVLRVVFCILKYILDFLFWKVYHCCLFIGEINGIETLLGRWLRTIFHSPTLWSS